MDAAPLDETPCWLDEETSWLDVEAGAVEDVPFLNGAELVSGAGMFPVDAATWLEPATSAFDVDVVPFRKGAELVS